MILSWRVKLKFMSSVKNLKVNSKGGSPRTRENTHKFRFNHGKQTILGGDSIPNKTSNTSVLESAWAPGQIPKGHHLRRPFYNVSHTQPLGICGHLNPLTLNKRNNSMPWSHWPRFLVTYSQALGSHVRLVLPHWTVQTRALPSSQRAQRTAQS